MNQTTTITRITTPLNHYQIVQGDKTHREKDELIFSLVSRSLSDACKGRSALDSSQAQLELVENWCMAPPSLNEGQKLLLERLFSIPGVTRLCLLTREPVFDLYVVGTREDLDIYDAISSALVDYKYDFRASAAYMYMTEAEFAACDTRGINFVFKK